eukprot:16441879-Heterocapsa_arctica.AAC.1
MGTVARAVHPAGPRSLRQPGRMGPRTSLEPQLSHAGVGEPEQDRHLGRDGRAVRPWRLALAQRLPRC